MSLFWPELETIQMNDKISGISESLSPYFTQLLTEFALPADLEEDFTRLYLPLTAWLADQAPGDKPLLVGINGAQGTGKSTICRLLSRLIKKGFGLRCCTVSIDDLYLTRAQRQQLKEQVHPLLATRGVPGTHDVELGLKLFKELIHATDQCRTPIPRFDKAIDDRAPESEWDEIEGRPDLILFEGWCVGAKAQDDAELQDPLNSLEATEDQTGAWRCYVNQKLKEEYRQLFAQLDLLVMLKVPDWKMVYRWRSKQEAQLAATHNGCGVMSEEALRRFVMHYERLTRHQFQEMPGRADLVLELSEEQRIVKVIKKAAAT